MKITIKHSNKLAPFEDLPEGMIFQDPASGNVYYIKTASVVDEDTGAEEWNCLNLDKYNFDCFGEKYMVRPIYDAELIIP